MITDYAARCLIETDIDCVEKRVQSVEDVDNATLTVSAISSAIAALDMPRDVLFLARIVVDMAEWERVEPSNVCCREAEEAFLDAAAAVVQAWDEMDDRHAINGGN